MKNYQKTTVPVNPSGAFQTIVVCCLSKLSTWVAAFYFDDEAHN